MNAQGLVLDESISTLPSDIIENIIWRLPTEEIIRASILSKEWRYSWSKVPKAAFYEDFFDDESINENQLPVIEQEFENPPSEMKNMSKRCKFFDAIRQFLLQHQGPLIDFTLSTRLSGTTIDWVEIDQILLHLSRKNTVKKLRLSSPCDMPLSIFSFHQLTDLCLSNCGIYDAPTFNGFGSLKTLCLEHVNIHKPALMHILSNNPLLKSFTMIIDEDEYGTIDELFQFLNVIEHLTLTVWEIECLCRGVVPRKLATALVHLKSLRLEGMSFLINNWLLIFILMIRSSPNLEKLTLEMKDLPWMNFDNSLYSVTMRDCSDIWLEHLIELEIENSDDTRHLLEFARLILAKSPILKKLRLKVVTLKLVNDLLSSPPASRMVEIVGFHGGKDHVIFRSHKSVSGS
ncbi:F-box/FBD/LRR-repeat protein At1g13570-like isoform X2 [Rutidosis leptorrhynchoides]|uniref:F-box/FBD/LRR-repeat protein At1g13570-like isoform X2 n=1 Tax=Rutidosis leptorrhynchoides TaxID=125765 RepID=UPI003A9954EB